MKNSSDDLTRRFIFDIPLEIYNAQDVFEIPGKTCQVSIGIISLTKLQEIKKCNGYGLLLLFFQGLALISTTTGN
jgi:hypothetical protein